MEYEYTTIDSDYQYDSDYYLSDDYLDFCECLDIAQSNT